MAMKFYVVEKQCLTCINPFSVGIKVVNGRNEYGFYSSQYDDSWCPVVIDAHFAVLALGYNEDTNDFCTVLEIERPNGSKETFYWWWEGHSDHYDRCTRPLFDDIQNLKAHYGMRILSNETTFDDCMLSYRADPNVAECFDSLDKLRDFLARNNGEDVEDATEDTPMLDHMLNQPRQNILTDDDLDSLLDRGVTGKFNHATC